MPQKAGFKDLINDIEAACSGVSERQQELVVALDYGAPIVRGTTVRVDLEAAE